MTADPYEQARPALDRIREATKQLGGRLAVAGSLAGVHDSPTTRAVAPG